MVSFIVPIYNAATTLEKALDSIAAQSFKNIQVICVNDGSTDESLNIIQKYVEQDQRFSVIDKPNEGYGSSCNKGLAASKGTWVAILEPDDWVEPDMCRDMLRFVNSFVETIDIIKTPYWEDVTDERTGVSYSRLCSYGKVIEKSNEPFILNDKPELIRHHPSIWSALYRRSFLEEFNIHFLPIPGAGWADNPFLYESLLPARHIVYLNKPFYHYGVEDTEKYQAFRSDHPEVMFERWNDMSDVLDKYQETDAGILQAHARRGFMYANEVFVFRSRNEEPVATYFNQMLKRMNADAVFAEPDINPADKQRFAQANSLEYAVRLNDRFAYKVTALRREISIQRSRRKKKNL